MKTITYSQARQSLAVLMDKTVEDHLPTVITRTNGKNCVLISQDDYNALEETAYLLRSPRNARHLMRSIAQSNSGKLSEKTLLDDE